MVSEDLGSQSEPGCLPTANLGAGAPSGCSETPLGGGAGLGPAGSAYKWPREERYPISKPLISCWSCLVPLDPVTQAFWSPFLGEAVASLGKMPECWDGVSEGSGAARGSGTKGIPQPMSGGESAFSRLTWGIAEARPAGPRLPGDPGLPCSGVAASPRRPGRGDICRKRHGLRLVCKPVWAGVPACVHPADSVPSAWHVPGWRLPRACDHLSAGGGCSPRVCLGCLCVHPRGLPS